MKLFSMIFNKHSEDKTNIPVIPSFSEIVKMMYDKDLFFSEEFQVIKVIYNEENTRRFILLKNNKGYYKYTYEELCVLNEDEWMHICSQKDAVPAFWNQMDRAFAYSFFGTEEEAFTMLKQEEIYKQYFT